ncbi:hypothetical protein G7K_1510-t1 [Saitoella complicata NRRL Y-17804]|uniref:Uncharacterized protein n=1 Tax=Saitoella complicata (strain BCRC 22490 / CBS 7301 / JCM 7358 / NBRC 10748 / NRRL Y-17804) TaxID=698492 RepID=A0A0E9NC46_SAICN|nr:hypothetical protein G7K_1510-t1 [Saitoella complicata NRRL Y-17804]
MYSSVSPIPSGYGPRYGAQPHFLKMTPEKFGRWAPSLVAWGATAGVAAIFLLSGLPRMKRDVLQKVPCKCPARRWLLHQRDPCF